MSHQRKIAVIGLGYVGLPVAVAFGLKDHVIGFDINPKRINDLKKSMDVTGEVTSMELSQSHILFTHDKSILQSADFFIVTVPTPSDDTHKPDLRLLHKACEILGPYLKTNDIVVIESTVYPGATQEECIPLLERYSNLKAGVDFSVGYSPERINPGDKVHTLSQVVKVISALDPETLDIIADVYSTVVQAGVYRCPSIKTAEAAKIIENTQRDLNIALMNELAIICERMGVDTQEVINAAKTKWNFLPFQPGLVGGHCIGVDPYYLTYKAKQLGYRPEVILAGRRINDGMGKYIADQTVKQMIHLGSKVKGAKVAILGLTFKENCRDLRNSKVIDVINELQSFGVELCVHDPIADKDEALKEYDIELLDWDEIVDVDAIVLCVAHRAYREMTVEEFEEKFDNMRLVIDVKAILDREAFADHNIPLWRL
ncbi:MAG: GDP-mannose dehydrogenase [Gammaproteobacteria bacterium 39-13]|nr:nucleotide sugar dehydrogenase [Gammaproteobacteria bacterium]OJV86927.1 MAG: GDP-mannose dehydrogenase [Gammaproteobacteria bacterium 39-13]